VELPEPDNRPAYEPNCYLCPGNARAGGGRNPQYTSTFAFDNDFPALVTTTPVTSASMMRSNSEEIRAHGELVEPRANRSPFDGLRTSGVPDLQSVDSVNDLMTAEAERGICRVLCFSPRHDLTLARMDAPSVRAVVDAWSDEYSALAALPGLAYATIFENRGAAMGASNPHPHCQIWATEHIPNEPLLEIDAFASYLARKGSCLLCDYLALELSAGERIVCANDCFVALVPFWAAWPFETLLVSRRHVETLPSLHHDERDALADILRELTTRYDNVFEASFPYSMGFHQQPLQGRPPVSAHLHAHFYPPLLRSATVRKFMVGFELLGSPQRDIAPEDAAARLRATASLHYADRLKPSASPSGVGP
jgi:UDPglucose--hexose-1-phosphate uridylyltransferase